MKHLIILLFLIVSNFCFAQNDYTILKNIDGKNLFRNSNRIIKYDSIKNKTDVKLYSIDTIKLIGKWHDFDVEKFCFENMITYAPILMNENNAILEIGMFNIEFHNNFTGYTSFKDFSKNYIEKFLRLNGKIISVKIDTEKNYTIYKLKIASRFNKNDYYTSYHLIGEKTNNVYRMVLYNIDETNFENFEEFLINTYNNN